MLKTRIVTAITMVLPLIILLVFAPQPVPTIVGLLMFTVAAWEWSQLVPRITRRGRVAVTTLYVALMLIVIHVALGAAQTHPDSSFFALGLLVIVALIWWLVATVCVFLYPFTPARWMIVVSGALIIVPAFSVLVQTHAPGWRPSPLLVATFLLVWAADIGAYFVGRAFGRHKLAPSVSPGKTWEGLVGGLLLALLVAFGLAQAFGLHPGRWLPLATLVVLASVVGDLAVSLFKRHAQVKDMGRLFPGHGGVLDRFDSFSAAAPVLVGLAAVFEVALVS